MNTAPTAPRGLIPITLNGQPQDCPPGMTVATLMERHHVAADAVATAVNGCFVPRCQRSSKPLQAGDSVTTFQPIVGG